MQNDSSKYDYIIAGAGCAGLSLLYRILREPLLNNKRILVLDQSVKNKNDRTWCYWEKEAGLFESIVHHQWQTLQFFGNNFDTTFDLKEYRYKMILGIDFYNFVLEFAKQFNNVVFKHGNITKIEEENDLVTVKTNLENYSGTFVFNSTNLFYPEITTENSLLQHFEGWVIKTKTEIFNDSIGTLMDFRLDQKNGDTFMYVLPTSPTEALIEYTLFSPKVLDKEEYKNALKDYISKKLRIKDYEILHTEFGVIPMSLANFKQKNNSKQIINIGTAGGYTKASSGYTFQFIQKNTAIIISDLLEGKTPLEKGKFSDKVYDWYDRTLLDVILKNKLTGKEIFSIMFKKLPPEKILKFLDNDSSLLEELKIMSSMPIVAFTSSAFKQIKKL